MTDTGVSSIFILNVGYDSVLLRTRTMVLRSKGYTVESAYSIEDALNRFWAGVFDLVILCHSISPDDRKRLISRIRSYGATTPAISVAAVSTPSPDPFASRTIGSSPDVLLSTVGAILQQDRSARQPL